MHFLWRSSKTPGFDSDASSTLATPSLFAWVDGVARGGGAVNGGENADGLGVVWGLAAWTCLFPMMCSPFLVQF